MGILPFGCYQYHIQSLSCSSLPHIFISLFSIILSLQKIKRVHCKVSPLCWHLLQHLWGRKYRMNSGVYIFCVSYKFQSRSSKTPLMMSSHKVEITSWCFKYGLFCYFGLPQVLQISLVLLVDIPVEQAIGLKLSSARKASCFMWHNVINYETHNLYHYFLNWN